MKWTIATAALALGACVGDADGATGEGAERSYALSGFDSVELSGPDDVRVSVGPEFSVRATGPAETLDRLEVTVEGDRLRVQRHGRTLGHDAGATVFVTMPSLRAASLAGSGDIAVDRVEGDEFAAAIGGSGDLTVKRVEVERLKGSIAGSGTLALAGVARELDASIAGSGDIEAGGLTADRARVSLMGSGDVKAAVRGDATVSLMGSGDVDLGPAARCTVSKAGSGTVRCGG